MVVCLVGRGGRVEHAYIYKRISMIIRRLAGMREEEGSGFFCLMATGLIPNFFRWVWIMFVLAIGADAMAEVHV